MTDLQQRDQLVAKIQHFFDHLALERIEIERQLIIYNEDKEVSQGVLSCINELSRHYQDMFQEFIFTGDK